MHGMGWCMQAPVEGVTGHGKAGGRRPKGADNEHTPIPGRGPLLPPSSPKDAAYPAADTGARACERSMAVGVVSGREEQTGRERNVAGACVFFLLGVSSDGPLLYKIKTAFLCPPPCASPA